MVISLFPSAEACKGAYVRTHSRTWAMADQPATIHHSDSVTRTSFPIHPPPSRNMQLYSRAGMIESVGASSARGKVVQYLLAPSPSRSPALRLCCLSRWLVLSFFDRTSNG
eukprot:gb/GECG01005514.1/.p1 GENE.gb/GECG01005514.1/~~gb/GECG01005514.1/.p1  ORF type:complete len:111 (+),score=3.12 gb/GECG01005514.1/:1-333(+)